MDPTSLASALVGMNAQQTQTQIGVAVLKKQFDAQKSVLTLLDPGTNQPPAPAGMGTQVDRTV